MNSANTIIDELMPFLVGLLTIAGTLSGAWLNYRYASKNKLKDDQIRIVKGLYKRVVNVEKSFIAIQVDHKLNKMLSEKPKEEAKAARDQVISFFDENAIFLPEKVAVKVEEFIQHFVFSHASLILDDYTGVTDKDVLAKMTKDIKKLQDLKETLRREFRAVIGVKK